MPSELTSESDCCCCCCCFFYTDSAKYIPVLSYSEFIHISYNYISLIDFWIDSPGCMAYSRRHSTLATWLCSALLWESCVERWVTWEQVPLWGRSTQMWKSTKTLQRRSRRADTSSRSKRAQSLHLFCKMRLWYLVQNLVFHFLNELNVAAWCIHKGKPRG